MKLNALSQNCSFKAVIEDSKIPSLEQKKMISIVKNSLNENNCFVDILGNKNIDIFISPNEDKISLDLKLITPKTLLKDKNDGFKVNLHVPPQSFDKANYYRLKGNLSLRTQRFLMSAINRFLR